MWLKTWQAWWKKKEQSVNQRKVNNFPYCLWLGAGTVVGCGFNDSITFSWKAALQSVKIVLVVGISKYYVWCNLVSICTQQTTGYYSYCLVRTVQYGRCLTFDGIVYVVSVLKNSKAARGYLTYSCDMFTNLNCAIWKNRWKAMNLYFKNKHKIEKVHASKQQSWNEIVNGPKVKKIIFPYICVEYMP